MAQLVPIPGLILFVVLLIRAEFQQNQKQIYVFKPLSTLLVIAVGALSLLTPAAESRYTAWVLAGLLLSMIGDVALMFPQPKAFMLGLVAFLLAHVAYTVVFTLYHRWQTVDWVTAALLLVIGIVVFRKLLTNVGRMKLPVIAYMVVICVMVNRALSTLFGEGLTVTQAWLVALGALLFWVSDLMLGINRFGRPFSWHRVSLAFYYAGQLLIALSASYF